MIRKSSLSRSALPKRKKPLNRGGRLRRNTPVKKVNRARKAKSFARQFGSVERVEFVKALPCVVGLLCEYGTPRENHHIRPRRTADYTAIVPLCVRHHREYHETGRASFEQRWGIDWEREAAQTEAAWQLRGATGDAPDPAGAACREEG